MAVFRAAYCTRDDVKSAPDIKTTARNDSLLDDSICSASDAVDDLLHRTFFPEDKTIYVDWPNFQRAYPWRMWLNATELADKDVNPPVVKTGTRGGLDSGTVIPANEIFWGNPQYPGAPYTYFELDRSSTAAFGAGPTPQRDTSITGTFGYWLKLAQTANLAASVSSTTATTLTVSAADAGVGDLVVIDTERMLLQGKTFIDTTIAWSAGLSSASAAQRTFTVPDGTQFKVGETLQADSERLLVVDIAANTLTVIRAWDGTVLAAHTSGTLFAARQWTVQRGMYGTTAATHSNSATVSKCLYPPLVKELALAEAVNSVLQKTAGYSRTVGEGANLQPISGAGLADVRARAWTSYGRKTRQRVI